MTERSQNRAIVAVRRVFAQGAHNVQDFATTVVDYTHARQVLNYQDDLAILQQNSLYFHTQRDLAITRIDQREEGIRFSTERRRAIRRAYIATAASVAFIIGVGSFAFPPAIVLSALIGTIAIGGGTTAYSAAEAFIKPPMTDSIVRAQNVLQQQSIEPISRRARPQ